MLVYKTDEIEEQEKRIKDLIEVKKTIIQNNSYVYNGIHIEGIN